jgi:hypothetical protein
MKKVISEVAVRRDLAKIDEALGQEWLRTHLDDCVRPLLHEPSMCSPAMSTRPNTRCQACGRCWIAWDGTAGRPC